MRFYSLPYANDIAFPSMHKCTSKTYTVDDNRAHLDTYTMLYIFGDEEPRYRNLNGLSVWFVIIRKNRSSSGPWGVSCREYFLVLTAISLCHGNFLDNYSKSRRCKFVPLNKDGLEVMCMSVVKIAFWFLQFPNQFLSSSAKSNSSDKESSQNSPQLLTLSRHVGT